jgi:hypothetical protein
MLENTMLKQRFLAVLIAGLSVLLLVACSDEQPTTTEEIGPTATTAVAQQAPTQAAASGTEQAYPAQQEQPTSPYPEPPSTGEALAGTIEDVPEPSSDSLGTVTGIVVIEAEDDSPVQEALLYLGRIIMLDSGQPGMSALNKQTAPHTQTNMAGQFIFSDIEPGNYTLILDRITDSFVLNQPGGGDLIIPVEAGQITDLGELRYPELPLLEQ